MAWSSIPNFGDPYAKVNERVHSSGARVIEVLYGARDHRGQPVSPTGSADGHGHWIALEINGTYQMLSWRHPAYEGGRQEYGRGRSSNALADLEADLSQREALCRRAEVLENNRDWKTASAEQNRLMEEWKKIYHWGTPKEQQLWERFQASRRRFYARRDQEQHNNRSVKQEIVSQAKSLAESTDWKAAGASFQTLFERWKKTGYAGADDSRLWTEFQQARQRFFDRRAKHFAALDQQRAASRKVKEDLIAQARNATQYSTDWKAAGETLRNLMARWKEAGSAGKELDEKLWAQFDHIRQDFFQRRKLHFEQQEAQFLTRASQKNQIIQEANAISSSRDYSARNAERMKALDVAWKGIGFAGSDRDSQLWEQFRMAKESFWAGRRAYAQQRQQEWRTKQYDAINRKRQHISNLEQQISDLQSKMSQVRNPDYLANMCRWVDEKRARIRELEMTIQDIQRKL